jgi:hypothetical protein
MALPNYLSETMSDNLLDQRIREQIESVYGTLDRRLQILEAPIIDPVTFSSSPNMLPNSHPEWSTLAYGTPGTTPATAGDTNYEAYNWLYETEATTDLSTNADPLLASGHSGFAGLNADAPVWDRVNGAFKLGSETTQYDISCPLPTDFVSPGQLFRIYFEASLAAADTDINEAQFYCGFWDDTSGQEKWIEGSAFTPTIGVFGATGSRTLEYKILAETDTGSQILSTAVSVSNAPAVLTSADHVRLFFSGAPGFIRYVIYRKDGSNYYRVGEIRNSIDLQFFDILESGDTVVPEAGYPSVSGSEPRAYAITSTFAPGAAGAFAIHTMTIQVPLTYNRSNTGNHQQYFRFGLSQFVASGSAREVVIRRISVAEGNGPWSRSPLDLQAASGPSISATSAPPPPGGGGTPSDPPPPGGGGPPCLTLDTPVLTPEGFRCIGDLKKDDWVMCGMASKLVKPPRIGTVQFVWEIECDNGSVVRCSDTHKWIRDVKDKGGRSARLLQVGDTLLGADFRPTKIIRKDKILGQVQVVDIQLPDPHLFIASGLVSHNRKSDDEGIYS